VGTFCLLSVELNLLQALMFGSGPPAMEPLILTCLRIGFLLLICDCNRSVVFIMVIFVITISGNNWCSDLLVTLCIQVSDNC
jgi:hypothetical protein